MSDQLLQVSNLTVHIDSKKLLDSLNLTIKKGETHVLMGPNGAGKSTLGHALMGHPLYEVSTGSILFDGEDLTQEKPDRRAGKGMFLSFQNPIEVPGVSLYNFLRTARTAAGASEHSHASRTSHQSKPNMSAYRRAMKEALKLLEMDEDYVSRELNVGFSGGEKKKSEILQMLLLKPRLAILDETDSGLDVDAVRIVSRGIREFQKEKDASLLIITHNTRILEYLDVDRVHILDHGRIVKTGDASLIRQINDFGFEPLLRTEAAAQEV